MMAPRVDGSGAGLMNSVLAALTAGLGVPGGPGGMGGFGVMVGHGPGDAATGSTGSSTTTSTLHDDMKKLQTDLQGIAQKSQVTLGQLASLRSDFQQIEAAATSAPSSATLTTLQNDIAAIGDQLPTATQVQQLQTDFTAVVQSEGVTNTTLIAQTFTDLGGVAQASNITATDVSTIAADKKAIENDLGAAGITSTPGSSTMMSGFFPGGPITIANGKGPGGGATVTTTGGTSSGIDPGGPIRLAFGGGRAGRFGGWWGP
jgi:hypothetical protein